MILRGAAAEALAELQAQYADGADPMAVLRQMSPEITHWVSIVENSPRGDRDPTIGPDERTRGRDIAARIPMRALTRLWQMLLKALEEVGQAPNAMMAAEMAIIRLTHVADLPDPEALIRKVQTSVAAGEFNRSMAPAQRPADAPRAQAPQAAAPRAPVAIRSDGAAMLRRLTRCTGGLPGFRIGGRTDPPHARHEAASRSRGTSAPRALLPGRIEFQPGDNAPRDFALRLGERLRGWTGGQRWAVSVVSDGGQPSIAEQRAAHEAAARARAMENPAVQAIFAAFRQRKSSRSVRSPLRSRLKSARARIHPRMS